MVELPAQTAHPVEALPNDAGYYTPPRLSHHLIYWDELAARAQRVGALRVSPDPACTSHLFADPMRWADVQGDILTALASLGITTRAYTMVELVMIGRWQRECHEFARPRDWEGYVVREAGRLMRPTLSEWQAPQLYRDSVRRMARSLGWRPADE